MEKSHLADLETSAKALKSAIARSQSGIAGLKNISKLGPAALSASSAILAELKDLEGEMQRTLKHYHDVLAKSLAAATAVSKQSGG